MLSTARGEDWPHSGVRASLRARLTELLVNAPDWPARARAGAALELYYEAGDAHSQLCAALARRWLPRLRVPLRIHLVPPPATETYPEAERQRAFAALDAERLAPCLGVPAPRALTPSQCAALAACLAAAPAAGAAFLEAEQRALASLAAGEDLPPATAAQQDLHDNAARRRRLGHYLPAMWQFRGEWFWAADRLDFLQVRLLQAGALDDAAPLAPRVAALLPLPPAPAPAPPLQFWFSFRSPYSYLAAVELWRRRAAGARFDLQVRPVLPMVMRGLPVPGRKRLYIVRDVKRCAQALQIPFGRLHDPVGAGVLRLLTIFPWQADADTQLRYCLVAAYSIWAEGLDLRGAAALRSVCLRSGLDWPAARARLAQGYDTRSAEAQRAALFAAGLWGVPSFRYGDFATWGQDRLWMIDEALRRGASAGGV